MSVLISVQLMKHTHTVECRYCWCFNKEYKRMYKEQERHRLTGWRPCKNLDISAKHFKCPANNN